MAQMPERAPKRNRVHCITPHITSLIKDLHEWQNPIWAVQVGQGGKSLVSDHDKGKSIYVCSGKDVVAHPKELGITDDWFADQPLLSQVAVAQHERRSAAESIPSPVSEADRSRSHDVLYSYPVGSGLF
eukprot:11468793-Karenia_brevis.AAC.1